MDKSKIKDVIREFTGDCNCCALSDDYLQEYGYETRAEFPMTIEFGYGIMYLRDDAVELLIERIKELENGRG